MGNLTLLIAVAALAVGNLGALYGMLKGTKHELREDIREVRNELKTEIGELRKDVFALKVDVAVLKEFFSLGRFKLSEAQLPSLEENNL